MIRKLTLAVGFGAGYVLGAKAGKERYTQIEGQFRQLLGQPAVKDLTNNVTSTASAAADKAKSTVNEKVGAVSDKVGSSSSSSTPSSSTSSVTPEVVVDLGPAAAAPATGTTGTSTAGTRSTTGTGTGTGTGNRGGLSTGPIGGASPSSSAPDVL